MKKSITIKWRSKVPESNFAAAESYLSLIRSTKAASEIVKKLQRAAPAEFKAKDIFRASGLSLLGVSNYHVEKDRHRIAKGKALSPLLLVRDSDNSKVIVADGYHRLCAVYSFDEDASIACRIV